MLTQTTRPDLTGKARVDLVKSDFDAIVWQKGYDVILEKSLKCPCRKKSDDQAQSSCKNCGGCGYVFINPTRTKMIVQSMNLQTKFSDWSETKLGQYKVTALDIDLISFMDRITIINNSLISSETLHAITVQIDDESKVVVRCDYPIKEIYELFYFENTTTPLTRLTSTQFVVDQEWIEIVDENIKQIPNLTLSIRYAHNAQVYIIDLPRSTISSEYYKTNNYDKFPIHAVARLSHYVLDKDKFSNKILLENNYDSTCKKVLYQASKASQFNV